MTRMSCRNLLMSKAPDSFKLNTYELPRRAGEMKEYELDIVVKEKFGIDLISVPAGEVIEVDARLESVTEGILLSADVYAVAQGECIRCLDPVEIVIERKIQELYNYEPTNERGKKKKRRDYFQAGHDATRAHLAALIQRFVMAIETTHAGVFAGCADGLSPSNVLMDIAT